MTFFGITIETRKNVPIERVASPSIERIEEVEEEVEEVLETSSLTEAIEKQLAEEARLKEEEAAKAKAEAEEAERIKQEEAAKIKAAEEAAAKAKAAEAAKATQTATTASQTVSKTFTANITAYCPCAYCCGKTNGITASGTKATANRTIAMSSAYAFGTQVKIGNTVYTVEDRGGAIQDNKIDIYFDTHQEALNFGRQYKTVEILN